MSNFKPYSKERAQKRLKGEDVFGFKIKVTTSRDSPCKNYQGHKVKSSNVNNQGPSHSNTIYEHPSFQLQQNNWKSIEQNAFKSKENSNFQLRRGSASFSLQSQIQDGSSSQTLFTDLSSQEVNEHIYGACALPFHYDIENIKATSSSDATLDERIIRTKNTPRNNSALIELVVSNIDSSISVNDIKKYLKNLLEKHIMISSLNVTTQVDGTPIAIIRVASQQDAQVAISLIHHHKLGYKRLILSYTQNNSLNPLYLREMVTSLLQEVPLHRMPLFKLLELLESRFHTNVSVSEVSRLKDICKISDEISGRIISLTSDIKTSPNNIGKSFMLYCSIHCRNGLENKGWGEPEAIQLPNLNIQLRVFSSKLNQLLESHAGILPLLSLPICYEVEFNETLPICKNGVPLEHLVTCVDNVQLIYGGPNKNIKYIRKLSKVDSTCLEKDEGLLQNMPPSILSNLQLFCRQLIDLLKVTEKCQLLLSRFIPAYHHHFGKQCRVADFGYTKLIDLLESQAVSNVIQILGSGSKKVMTLTHSTQIRRFTSDLLRILKNQNSKQLSLQEFPTAYEKTLTKTFSSVEYGLCNLLDLLDKVPENTVVISKSLEAVMISIPKREQTAEEIMRTKQFSEEVIKLLQHSPQCSMLFNKFVPAYHHHFGHQCKVSDYGFTKLIELFDSIPETVKIEKLPDGERTISLTEPKAFQVLANQFVHLIKNTKSLSLPLSSLYSEYMKEYGYGLKPSAYNCTNIKELISKLSEFVQITYNSEEPSLVLVDSELVSTVIIRIWSILLRPPYSLDVPSFITKYKITYNGKITIDQLEQLASVCKISRNSGTTYISLTEFYELAAKIYYIIFTNGGQIPFNQLDMKYRKMYGITIPPSDYNFNTLEELLSEMTFLIEIRGRRKKMNLQLNRNLVEYGVPFPKEFNFMHNQKQSEGQFKDSKGNNFLESIPTIEKSSPPKPDSPTTSDNTWCTPIKVQEDNLCIKMPQSWEAPKLIGNPYELVSPVSNLLLGIDNPMPWSSIFFHAPEPCELPMPDKLLGKDTTSDESADSGVINNSQINSENEMDVSQENGTVLSNGKKFMFLK